MIHTNPTRVVMADPSAEQPFREIADMLMAAEKSGMFMVGCIFAVPNERRVLIAVNHHDARAIIEDDARPPMREALAIVGGVPRPIQVAEVQNPAVWLEYHGGAEGSVTLLDIIESSVREVGNLMLKDTFATQSKVNNIENLFKNPENPNA